MKYQNDDIGNRVVTPLQESALLEEVVRALVRDPGSVKVIEEKWDTGRVYLYVQVSEHDKKRVIGKRGRTISSIRKIFSAIGALENRQIIVELSD